MIRAPAGRCHCLSALLLLAACTTSDRTTGTGTPPSEPTHHAVVEGSVTDAAGVGLEGAGVGARFAQGSLPDRQLSVVGGTYTQGDGTYRFTVEGTAPHRSDGVADFQVHATIYAPPGGRVRQDSVLVTARFAPLDQPPDVVRVPQLRLPDR